MDIGFRCSSRVMEVLLVLLLSGDFSEPELEMLVDESPVGEPCLCSPWRMWLGPSVDCVQEGDKQGLWLCTSFLLFSEYVAGCSM